MMDFSASSAVGVFKFLFRGQGPFFANLLGRAAQSIRPSADLCIENASREIEILDKDGRSAVYRQTLLCRSLKDGLCNIDTLFNPDGAMEIKEVVGLRSPPKVERHHGSQLSFALERAMERNEKFYCSIDTNLSDAFMADEEFWEIVRLYPCKNLLFRVVFPTERPPKDWTASFLNGRSGRERRKRRSDIQPCQTRVLSKPAIEWVVKNLYEDYYRIDWRW